MIPTGLKVGDIFEDNGRKFKVTKVIGDERTGMYESELYTGKEEPEVEEKEEKVEEKAEKKPAPKRPVKKTATKKTTR